MSIISSILLTLTLYQGSMVTDYALNDSVFNIMLPAKIKYNIVEEPIKPVYKPEDLTRPSKLKPKHIDEIIKGTSIEGMGYTFIQAERELKINALFLLALTKQESQWGESNFGKNRNNLTGYNAHTSKPSRAKVFNSKEESLIATANLLNKQYLNDSGLYYRGLSIYDVNVYYCQDVNNKPLKSWSTNINNIANTLKNNIHKEQKEVILVKKRIKLMINDPK